MASPPPNRRLPPPPPRTPPAATPADRAPSAEVDLAAIEIEDIPISADSAPPPQSMVPTSVGAVRPGSVPRAAPIPRELSDTSVDGVRTVGTEAPVVVIKNSKPESNAPPPQRNTLKLPAICTFGRYDLLGRLALGGMAEIFLARESTAGANRYLVIKRILPHVADDDQFIAMFMDEAHLAMRLNHPGICHIYEFGQEQDSYFIAMEWVNGVALGKLIRRARAEGGVPIPIAAKIIASVAESLQYAHRAKDENGRALDIVHRDVSPQNVMIGYDGHIKLLDFGIAKAATHATRTQAGQVKGKFAYMSPQQCLGDNIDGRADVFALGVCAYELLTGKPLYHRKTEYETMRAVIEDPVPSLRSVKADLPEAIDLIVQKALAKNPEERYHSAGELQMALEDMLSDMRQRVNAAKIAEYMEKLYLDEIKRGPLVDSTPFGASFQQLQARQSGAHFSPGSGSRSIPGSRPSAPSASAATPQSVEVDVPPKKSRGGVIAMLVVVLLAAGGGGAWWYAQREQPGAGTRRERPGTGAGTGAGTPEGTAAVVPGVEGEAPPEGTDPEAGLDDVVPAATTGSVLVQSTPAGATVHLGERTPEGRTPVSLDDIAPGVHEVRVEHDGYEPFTTEVTIRAGEQTTVEAPLVARERRPVAPSGPPGMLSVNTRPWSKVYLGNRLLGTTPIGSVRVPSGSARLRFVDRDGNTHRRTVQVPANDHARAFFDLPQ